MVIFGLKPIGLIYKPNATNCMGHTIKIRGLKNYMSNVESDLDIISETVGKFLCEIKLATVHYWWSDCHMNTAVRPIIISVRKWYSLRLPNSVTFLKKKKNTCTWWNIQLDFTLPNIYIIAVFFTFILAFIFDVMVLDLHGHHCAFVLLLIDVIDSRVLYGKDFWREKCPWFKL